MKRLRFVTLIHGIEVSSEFNLLRPPPPPPPADFAAFGCERHTPALWLRAPLTLRFGEKNIDLCAIPDLIGLSPETLKLLDGVDGDIGCWRYG